MPRFKDYPWAYSIQPLSYFKTFFCNFLPVIEAVEWKGINRKQSTRFQHLSRLKASAFFSLHIFLVFMKHSNLYLGLVLPSGGWQSLIRTLKPGNPYWWERLSSVDLLVPTSSDQLLLKLQTIFTFLQNKLP